MNGVKNLFMGISAICLYSLVKCLQIFCLSFKLLNSESSFYILDKILCWICSLQISSLSVIYVFILLKFNIFLKESFNTGELFYKLF